MTLRDKLFKQPWIAEAGGSIPPLLLPRPELHQLCAWARAGYPLETCGLLIGDRSGDALRVVRAVQVENIEPERSRDRYLLDPAQHLKHERSASAEGLEILGVWHSHPDHPARPSKTDFDAAWEGWSYLILSVDAGGVLEHRSWRLSAGSFVEEPIKQSSPVRQSSMDHRAPEEDNMESSP